MNKILDKNNYKSYKSKLTRKKIVLCHGVFDVLHFGHVKHLKAAKKFGDTLIVSITSDKFVNKGPGRPFFDLSNRIETIAALECVDFVFISDSSDALLPIKLFKPNFYCKGQDYKNSKDDITGKIIRETNEVKKYG